MTHPLENREHHFPTPKRALLFNVQYHATEDGPGIRTSLFFMGCLMHCPWCHNPEGISPRRKLICYEMRCLGTGKCLEVCPRKALTLTPQGMVIHRDLCDACGKCVDACPAGALEVIGKEYTLEELVSQVLVDRVFYQKSGGGVTLSGGEPSLQTDFCERLMIRLKEEGVHLALDTCGGIAWPTLQRLVNRTDLVLYDLKLMDPHRHVLATGIPLERVLENTEKIARSGKPLWIRTPVIPGVNDTAENIRQTARFIREKLPTVERYDLLAFNHTCVSKYQRLGLYWDFAKTPLLSEETMEALAAAAIQEGLDCVRWSGLTRPDRDHRAG
jgi:pyruvate formate lyase activating enzyme